VAVEAEEEQGDEKEEKRPSKLAIGVEGGFSPEGPDTRAETSIALPNPDLPELVLQAVEAATTRTSATAADAAADNAAAWEEGERRVSRYAADLPQLEVGLGRFGRSVPPNPELWECEASGMRENLWLNLSTVRLKVFFFFFFEKVFSYSLLFFSQDLTSTSRSFSLSKQQQQQHRQ
jgi:hypothetical protein